MIINQQHWAWHFVDFRIIQPIRALLIYYKPFLLVISYYYYWMRLTYLNHSSLKIKYVNRS